MITALSGVLFGRREANSNMYQKSKMQYTTNRIRFTYPSNLPRRILKVTETIVCYQRRN